MERKKLTIEEKTRALLLAERGNTVVNIACKTGISRQAVYDLHHAAATLPPSAVPGKKKGTGTKKKTSPKTDKVLQHEVLANPSVTDSELKNKSPDLLKDVIIQTIQYRPQHDLGLPAFHVVKKPMPRKCYVAM